MAPVVPTIEISCCDRPNPQIYPVESFDEPVTWAVHCQQCLRIVRLVPPRNP